MCIYRYIRDYIYVYIHTSIAISISICGEREDKIVLVGLAEGTIGGKRGKENVRE
jgi:hypothetical protein